ncbi:MAG: peptidase, partial [Alphaproteobacteria bacterium]|nr:peptidase [Alphaproteobacteria bacterium]
MRPIFDGHNDVLLRLWSKGGEAAVENFIAGDGQGHMDLPRMEKGGFAGGFFAIFVPNPNDPDHDDNDPNPPPAGEVSTSAALAPTAAMAALLLRIARQAPERFRLCRTAAEICAARVAGAVAAVMHIEGAECIDPSFHALDLLHAAGLRSIGPV